MSTQTNESFRDPLHEKLCAWLLGEASPDAAREVEAALESDPELRAERARIESTIGIVRGAFPAQEHLSGDAMAALASAAHVGARPEEAAPNRVRSAPTPWYRAGAFRAAAALTIVLGGTLFALRAGDGFLGNMFSDEVARVSEPSGLALGDADTVGKEGTASGSDLARLTYSVAEEAFERPAQDAAGAKLPGERGLPSLAAASDPARVSRLSRGLANAPKPQADRLLDARGNSDAPSREQGFDLPDLDGNDLSGRLAELEDLTLDRKAAGEAGESLRILRAEASESKDEQHGVVNEALKVTGGVDPATGPSSPATIAPGRSGESATRLAGGAGDGANTGSDEFFLGHGENDRFEREAKRRQAKRGEAVDGEVAAGRRVRGGGQAQVGGTLPEETLRELEELGYGGGESETLAAGGEEELEELAQDVRLRSGYVQDFDIGIEGDDDRGGEVEDLLALADELRAVDGLAADSTTLGEDRQSHERKLERLLAVPRALDRLRFDRRLSDDELSRLAELLQRRYLQDCRRRPQETPRDMYYRWWGDNSFEDTVRDAQSTFSVDVDTASYVLARRYLREGHLPVRAQVRTEEFLNYFTPDLPAPTEGTFAVHTELAPSRFGGPSERWMLRVGVRGKDVAEGERQPLAITFVVDTSGSMRENNRLEVVKHAIRLLVGQLDSRDSIGIVAFASEPRLILPMTSAASRDRIESALHPLQPDGSTNAEGGLRMGYELARTALDPNVHSRVVFLSDGVANVGQTDQDRISQDVAVQRSQGIYLNTIGVGMNNHNDVFLEQLANKGDGICDYVDNAESARRAIVDRFTGAMIPIASDVKIQVEFDPSRVVRYRLLGYENRAIADKDFRNDAVDAGEVGAGHQVVALYELELGPERDGAPLATVRLRWKEPKATGQHPAEISVTETETAVHWEGAVAAFASASTGYRRSVLAAQLAEFLRRSSHAADDSFTTLFEDARALALEVKEEESVELAELVGKTIELGLPMQLQRDAIETLIDEYRRQQILEARLDALERAKDAEDLRQEIQRRNLELELRLQELLLQELKRKNG